MAGLSQLGERTVTAEGHEVRVQLVWDSEPARAAAALLLVLLRHALRYRNLQLASEPTGLADIITRYRQIPMTWNETYVLPFTRTITSPKTPTRATSCCRVINIMKY